MGVNFDRPVAGNDSTAATRTNPVAAVAVTTAAGATAGATAAVATDTVKLTGRPGEQGQVSFFAPTAPAKETSTASDIIGAATEGINIAFESAKKMATDIVAAFRAV